MKTTKTTKTSKEIVEERNEVASSKVVRVNLALMNAIAQKKLDEKNAEIDRHNALYPDDQWPHITWVPMEVPNEYFYTPDFQRLIDLPRVAKIKADFRDELFQIKSACYVNGLLILCDGLQSISFNPRGSMWVRYFPNSDMRTAAFIMGNQYKNVRRISPAVLFNCNREYGYEREVKVGKFLDSKNITVVSCRNGKKNNINCIGQVLKIYERLTMSGVKMAINTIIDAGWNQYDNGFGILSLEIGSFLCSLGVDRKDNLYNKIIKAMRATTPSDFVIAARTKCPGSEGKHGELTIQRYVSMLMNK